MAMPIEMPIFQAASSRPDEPITGGAVVIQQPAEKLITFTLNALAGFGEPR